MPTTARRTTDKSSPRATRAKGNGAKHAETDSETLLRYYRDMLLIRRFEEKAGQMYGMGLIGVFCHLYIGQEAVVVGMQAAIGPKDAVITSYRDHGHMLACGMDPKGVMAELTGRRAGYSKAAAAAAPDRRYPEPEPSSSSGPPTHGRWPAQWP